MESNAPEGDITYKSGPVVLREAYCNIYNRKDQLEQKGFICNWWFERLDEHNSWFMGDTSVKQMKNSTRIVLPAILKNLDDETLMLLPSYDRDEKVISIFGSTKIYSDQEKYAQVIDALEAFEEITGIELIIELDP